MSKWIDISEVKLDYLPLITVESPVDFTNPSIKDGVYLLKWNAYYSMCQGLPEFPNPDLGTACSVIKFSMRDTMNLICIPARADLPIYMSRLGNPQGWQPMN